MRRPQTALALAFAGAALLSAPPVDSAPTFPLELTTNYDWDCDGIPGYLVRTLEADGTWTDTEGANGTWAYRNNNIRVIYDGGATFYEATRLEGTHCFEGTFEAPYWGLFGCWDGCVL